MLTMNPSDLPNVDTGLFRPPTNKELVAAAPSNHRPGILLLYGSLRERSFSRLADAEDASHPKVQELRDVVQWSEGMVWCSPERHGAMTGIMKTQTKFTLLVRDRSEYLTDRYSERRESAEVLSKRVDQRSI